MKRKGREKGKESKRVRGSKVEEWRGRKKEMY